VGGCEATSIVLPITSYFGGSRTCAGSAHLEHQFELGLGRDEGLAEVEDLLVSSFGS
jgi:hypothetical protein